MIMDKFTILLIAVAVLGVGFIALLAVVFFRTKGEARAKAVTRFLFMSTQVAALGWVSASYLIAAYSTIRLGQPFPVDDLSKQAIDVMFGNVLMKVVGNIFEHNSGGIFGTSDKKGV